MHLFVRHTQLCMLGGAGSGISNSWPPVPVSRASSFGQASVSEMWSRYLSPEFVIWQMDARTGYYLHFRTHFPFQSRVDLRAKGREMNSHLSKTPHTITLIGENARRPSQPGKERGNALRHCRTSYYCPRCLTTCHHHHHPWITYHPPPPSSQTHALQPSKVAC